MPNPKIKDFLTVSQAAKFKEVSRTAIYDAIKRKQLPASEVMGRPAIRRNDLLAWEVRPGRPSGALSKQHKARISAALKKSWAERKKSSPRKKE
jgi:predicted DNA-binding transcriptional regulator AlpA